MGDVVTLREHFEALHVERELRYQQRHEDSQMAMRAALTAAKEAIAIKERADERALELDREIRAYKDEKANNLRDQLGAERGSYATKVELQAAVRQIDLLMKPLAEYVTRQQGKSSGYGQLWAGILAGVAAGSAILASVMLFVRVGA